MAAYSPGVNDPVAVKLWSKKLFREALKQTMAGRFIGESSNSLIQLLTDTKKSAGDRIRTKLRMQLSGTGVSGDSTLEGQEESLTLYTDDIFIDQLRHAVRSGGKMSEQRVDFTVREEARLGLQDWWAGRIDTWVFNQLAGYTDQADTRYTGMQAAIAPDADHLIVTNNDGTEASLSAADSWAFKLSDIDRLVTKAKTYTTATTPILRPIRYQGEDKYILFLHTNAMYKLRTANTSTVGNYVDLFKAQLQGGKYRDNPIFTGASFEYNNTLVYESTYVPIITGTPASGAKADYRRNIFCGAQAATMAVGQGGSPTEMSWFEELFDYGNQLGVEAGMIAGVKKTRFNSKDFGTIVCSSYAPAV